MHYRLQIERLSHDLRGIAFAPYQQDNSDLYTWFVEGALPGEQVLVEIINVHRQRIDARLVQVEQASTMRIAPHCPHYRVCGGCQLQHVAHADQLQLKQQVLQQQLQTIARQAQLPPLQLLSGEAWQYRRRARLSVRWMAEQKHLAFGFRAHTSQKIVDIEHCPVLTAPLQALLTPLTRCLRQWTRPRLLGHVELVAADNLNAIVLRVLEAPDAHEEALLQQLLAETGAQLLLDLGGEQPVYWGGPMGNLLYRHRASGTQYQMTVSDFVQANDEANQQLIDTVLAWLEPLASDRLLELFSGMGNFTLPLAAQLAHVEALEGSASLLEKAAAQAAQLGRHNITLRQMDLSEKTAVAGLQHCANKLLLDPPRDGALAVARQLPLTGVERIVYVSCNPSTLARDIDAFGQRGFRLTRLACVDMFPQIAHIEAVALLQRDTEKSSLVAKKVASKPINTARPGAGFRRLKR